MVVLQNIPYLLCFEPVVCSINYVVLVICQADCFFEVGLCLKLCGVFHLTS